MIEFIIQTKKYLHTYMKNNNISGLINSEISQSKKILFWLFSACQKIFLVIIPLTTQKLIEAATDKNLKHLLDRRAGITLVLLILFMLCLSLKMYYQNKIEVSINYYLKSKILKKINELDYLYLTKKETGFFLQRLNIDIEKIKFLIIEGKSQFILNAFYVSTIFIIMFNLNKKLSLVIFMIIPIILIISKYFAPIIEKTNRNVLNIEESINTEFEEGINGNYTLRINNATKAFEKKFDKTVETGLNAKNKAVYVDIIYDVLIVTGIMNIANLIIYWFGGHLAIENNISIASLVAFTLYFSRIWTPIEFFLDYSKKLQIAEVSMNRLDELLSVKTNTEHKVVELSPLEKIDFTQFSFLLGRKIIFENMSFSIKSGDVIGIYGDNGSGKSTLANILVKILDTEKGAVYYNDIDFVDIAPKAIRNKICLVPADSYIFSTDLDSNINLGMNDNNSISISLLNEIFKDRNDKIAVRELSSGEKKIISILRAINTNADLYIFDEPYNFVDDDNKKKIYSLIKKHFMTKTVLIISHDQSIFKLCNRICKIEKNMIVENCHKTRRD